MLFQGQSLTRRTGAGSATGQVAQYSVLLHVGVGVVRVQNLKGTQKSMINT